MTIQGEVCSRPERGPPDVCCNTRSCSSYFIMSFAGFLIFIGLFLAFYTWQYMWIVISGIGVFLLLVGTCMYYCMVDKYYDQMLKRHRNKHTIPTLHQIQELRLQENEDLLPSAPLHNVFSSASQLCLLPAYNPSSCDDTSIITLPNTSSNQNYNQIMLNGQNFLLVPMISDGSNVDSTSLLSRQVSQSGPLIQATSNTEETTMPESSAIIRNIIVNPACENQLITHENPTRSSIIINEGLSPRNEQLYVTLLTEQQNHGVAPTSNQSTNLCRDNEHSTPPVTARTTYEPATIELPSCDSNFDLSSNASTVIDNLCTNVVIPTVNLTLAESNTLENPESQTSEAVSITPEVQALGGATGLNVHHPDYVSASDDDSISCGRSSPPPSYAEVAREEGYSVE